MLVGISSHRTGTCEVRGRGVIRPGVPALGAGVCLPGPVRSCCPATQDSSEGAAAPTGLADNECSVWGLGQPETAVVTGEEAGRTPCPWVSCRQLQCPLLFSRLFNYTHVARRVRGGNYPSVGTVHLSPNSELPCRHILPDDVPT